tara:strand:- start:5108 stop:6043 length:936 start_codon:yes stop_codon:yes gene_type:complete
MSNRAICITCGEQSENHAGMKKQGDGLADNGYSVEELDGIKNRFFAMGGVADWYDLKEMALSEEEKVNVEDAVVLVLRCGVDILLRNAFIGKIKEMDKWNEVECDLIQKQLYDSKTRIGAKSILKELTSFEWDKTYYDTRRSKWLNKRARFNVCFGPEDRPMNKEDLSGTIIGYDRVPRMAIWKNELEKIIGDTELEAEGNLYQDAKKQGIGFHGDGERKKVAAGSFCDDDVLREINWNWYIKGRPFGKRIRIQLKNGDCYIMSEKASGFDWKKKIKIIELEDEIIKIDLATLRHAAGVEGSKYLVMKKYD